MDLPTNILVARANYLEAVMRVRTVEGPGVLQFAQSIELDFDTGRATARPKAEDDLAYWSMKAAVAKMQEAYAELLDAYSDAGFDNWGVSIYAAADKQHYQEITAVIDEVMTILAKVFETDEVI